VVAKQKGQVTQITVASQIRSLVYIKVTDAQGRLNLTRAWRLDKAGIDFWHFNTPVYFTVAAANRGNVHLEVRGAIEIRDVIRNQKIKLDVPLFNILSGTNKEIAIPWREAPFIGYFQGNIRLTYDDVHFETRNFSFVIIPLLTLLGVLVAVVAIIMAVALYIRKLKKRLVEAERRLNNT
jgi:hypothetical protein